MRTKQPTKSGHGNEPRKTLQDVARVAGVHYTTVSRSLRGDPQIAAKTRERVRKIAAKMGYEPDPMLQALARYRMREHTDSFHGTLAWLINIPKESDTYKKTRRADFNTANEWASHKGYRFETFNLADPDLTPERIFKIMASRGIRGILLPPQRKPETRLDLDFSGFSVVTIGNTLETPDLHRVSPAQFDNAHLLSKHLLETPGLRVGLYLPGLIDRRTNGRISAAFWRAQQDIPPEKRIPIHLPEDYDEADFRAWMTRHPMDVLIATPQPSIEWLGRMNLRIPEDIRVASPTGNIEKETSFWIEEEWDEIYRSAVDFLISQIERNLTGEPDTPRRITIRGTLMTRREIS
ncbi:MAG: LacI family DNA-binding transcriptional regulator [Verrucomicrobia bacterium]|nr:LacI family DNA-binding transcriptional regulator [Verrucomicrobiota bacterium]MCH8525532.1 LacI family transcriptional regulator [Kiritimatiellia bacterium]